MRKTIVILLCCIISATLSAQSLPFEEWYNKYSQCDSIEIGFSDSKDPIGRYVQAIANAIECYMIRRSSISCSSTSDGESYFEYIGRKYIDFDVIDIFASKDAPYYVAVKIQEGNSYQVLYDSNSRDVRPIEIKSILQIKGISNNSSDRNSMMEIISKTSSHFDGSIQKNNHDLEIHFIDKL